MSEGSEVSEALRDGDSEDLEVGSERVTSIPVNTKLKCIDSQEQTQ